MYRTIRNIHLLAGVVVLPFLLMYGLSAVQMAHPRWFKSPPKVEQSTLTLPAGIADARALTHTLLERELVRGELLRASAKGDALQANIVRPGTVYIVQYSRDNGATSIRTERSSFMLMLNRLHHIAGLHHDYGLVNVWGFALGMVGAVMILLAGSGLYLWFKTYKERRIGAVLLGANLAFSLVMIIILRTA